MCRSDYPSFQTAHFYNKGKTPAWFKRIYFPKLIKIFYFFNGMNLTEVNNENSPRE